MARSHWDVWLVSCVVFCVIFAIVMGRLTPLRIVDTKIEPDHVAPGGIIHVERDVDWNRRDCSNLKVTAELIDSLKIVHSIEPKDARAPVQSNGTNRDWNVPLSMPWGIATYRSTLAFSCFPFYDWWPITVETHPIPFKVVGPR